LLGAGLCGRGGCATGQLITAPSCLLLKGLGCWNAWLPYSNLIIAPSCVFIKGGSPG